MQRRHVTIVAVLVAAIATLNACGGGDDDGGGGGAADAGTAVTIQAKDFAFSPTAIDLTAGEPASIEFENEDDTDHNLTIADLDVDEDVGGGDSATIPIETDAGTFAFQCKFHPSQMKGTITIT